MKVEHGSVLLSWEKNRNITWVYYNTGRKQRSWGFKLAQHATKQALSLMEKHGLTPEAIRSAHEARKEENKQAWEAHQKKNIKED
jgi:hypothetical protein